MAQDDKKPAKAAIDDAPPAPVVLLGEPSAIDPHLLPKASADWAGKYEIKRGTVRIGDQFYGEGSVLQLGADDGKNFTDAGVAERYEG